MNNQLIERAEILIQQNRFIEANKILPEIIANEPNNPYLLAMHSNVLMNLKKIKEANDLIDKAIGLAPDVAYFYYVKAILLVHDKKYDASEEKLREAINIDPAEATFYAYLASIKLVRKKFKEALRLANEALNLDPEDIDALNIRSTALIKLNNEKDAFKTIEGALIEDPNNPYTHANYGWSLLEQGKVKKSLIHFTEALKNDPNLEIAQSGMVEALKAKYFLYRLFLKYSFWMSNLTSKYQWRVIIFFYIGYRILNYIARQSETLRPFLTPILIVLAIFAFSTWIMSPISNLFLRLNVYGRNLLSKNELKSSNFVGLSILILLLGGVLYFMFGEQVWLAVAIFGFGMMIPSSVMFSPTKYKNSLLIYAGVMFAIGSIAIIKTFNTDILTNDFSIVFMVGLVLFQWFANFLLIDENNI